MYFTRFQCLPEPIYNGRFFHSGLLSLTRREIHVNCNETTRDPVEILTLNTIGFTFPDKMILAVMMIKLVAPVL